MAKVIECPQVWLGSIYELGEVGVFLAGGITDCPDWQTEMIKLLDKSNLTLLNPRRTNFDITNPEMTLEQIEWEHRYMRYSDAVLFWFPAETLCPITLYELGKCSAQGKHIFVGTHPDYKRKIDVEVQTRLERPTVKVVSSLESLAEQVLRYPKW